MVSELMENMPRAWSESKDTPRKFRADPGGPNCPCCRKLNKRSVKRLRMKSIRARAKEELRRETA